MSDIWRFFLIIYVGISAIGGFILFDLGYWTFYPELSKKLEYKRAGLASHVIVYFIATIIGSGTLVFSIIEHFIYFILAEIWNSFLCLFSRD